MNKSASTNPKLAFSRCYENPGTFFWILHCLCPKSWLCLLGLYMYRSYLKSHWSEMYIDRSINHETEKCIDRMMNLGRLITKKINFGAWYSWGKQWQRRLDSGGLILFANITLTDLIWYDGDRGWQTLLLNQIFLYDEISYFCLCLHDDMIMPWTL